MLSDRRFGRVASIYDIHGNLPALNAVLAQIRRADVDLVVVGGDVLPGPMPRETLECLLQLDLPVQFIHGNGDRVVREQMEGIEDTTLPDKVREVVRWTAQQLDVGHQHVLSGWASTLRLEIAGLGDVLFCHATPRNDTEIFSKLTAVSRLLPVFEPANASVVICGHTHM
ncbi:MAG: metallophosphoesterase, partial [Acidobacteria bacterium]|nr:metallophosphoesterase [Acidobacteriota bacterium]